MAYDINVSPTNNIINPMNGNHSTRTYYERNRELIAQKVKAKRSNAECRAKESAYRKAYREKMSGEQKAKVKEQIKAYRDNNKQRISDQGKAYYERNRDRIRRKKQTEEYRTLRKDYHLKRKYGIPLDQWNKMLSDQDGKCLICQSIDFGQHGPHTDHDSSYGHVRGLLCHKCNTAIGLFHHDVKRLRKAIEYLDKEVLFIES